MNSENSINGIIKNVNIEYFNQLISIAMADDVITNNEMELLRRIGVKLGFSEIEIEELIKKGRESKYNRPEELSRRFGQIYDLVKMTLIDGSVNKNEMRLTTNFALKSGFVEKEIPNLLVLLISGIKQGVSKEDLFDTYQMAKKS